MVKEHSGKSTTKKPGNISGYTLQQFCHVFVTRQEVKVAKREMLGYSADTKLTTHMTNKISKEDILLAVTNDYYDDYDFINKINDLTYHRKVTLYKQTQLKQTNNEQLDK